MPWEPEPKMPKVRGKDALLALSKDMDLSRFSFFQQPTTKWTFTEDELKEADSSFVAPKTTSSPTPIDELERKLKDAQATLDLVTGKFLRTQRKNMALAGLR